MNYNFYYLASFILFLTGLILLFSKKHLMAIFLGAELILNSAALNFATYSKAFHFSQETYLIPLIIILIGTAEAAIILGIVVHFFRIKGNVHTDDAVDLMG